MIFAVIGACPFCNIGDLPGLARPSGSALETHASVPLGHPQVIAVIWVAFWTVGNTGCAMSPFFDHVVRVVFGRAQKQVRGVNASRDVTLMADE